MKYKLLIYRQKDNLLMEEYEINNLIDSDVYKVIQNTQSKLWHVHPLTLTHLMLGFKLQLAGSNRKFPNRQFYAWVPTQIKDVMYAIVVKEASDLFEVSQLAQDIRFSSWPKIGSPDSAIDNP